MARKKLVKAYDVIREILKTQTANEIKIIFERERNKLTIKGDKTYVLLPYKKLIILFADGDAVRDDIKYSDDLSSNMDSVLYWSALEYERCEDLKTYNITYLIKKSNKN